MLVGGPRRARHNGNRTVLDNGAQSQEHARADQLTRPPYTAIPHSTVLNPSRRAARPPNRSAWYIQVWTTSGCERRRKCSSRTRPGTAGPARACDSTERRHPAHAVCRRKRLRLQGSHDHVPESLVRMIRRCSKASAPPPVSPAIMWTIRRRDSPPLQARLLSPMACVVATAVCADTACGDRSIVQAHSQTRHRLCGVHVLALVFSTAPAECPGPVLRFPLAVIPGTTGARIRSFPHACGYSHDVSLLGRDCGQPVSLPPGPSPDPRSGRWGRLLSAPDAGRVRDSRCGNARPGASIVEVGCGAGGNLLYLRERLTKRGFRFIGFDINSDVISSNRPHGCDDLTFEVRNCFASDIAVPGELGLVFCAVLMYAQEQDIERLLRGLVHNCRGRILIGLSEPMLDPDAARDSPHNNLALLHGYRRILGNASSGRCSSRSARSKVRTRASTTRCSISRDDQEAAFSHENTTRCRARYGHEHASGCAQDAASARQIALACHSPPNAEIVKILAEHPMNLRQRAIEGLFSRYWQRLRAQAPMGPIFSLWYPKPRARQKWRSTAAPASAWETNAGTPHRSGPRAILTCAETH